MIKWLSAPLAAAVMTMGLLGAAPAQAAGHRIQGSTAFGAVNGGLVFVQSKCQASLAQEAPNGISGIDTYIADVTFARAQVLFTSWSTATTIPGTFPSLAVSFVDDNCSPVSTPGFAITTTAQGPWHIPVPPTAKWMMITASFAIDTTIHW